RHERLTAGRSSGRATGRDRDRAVADSDAEARAPDDRSLRHAGRRGREPDLVESRGRGTGGDRSVPRQHGRRTADQLLVPPDVPSRRVAPSTSTPSRRVAPPSAAWSLPPPPRCLAAFPLFRVVAFCAESSSTGRWPRERSITPVSSAPNSTISAETYVHTMNS